MFWNPSHATGGLEVPISLHFRIRYAVGQHGQSISIAVAIAASCHQWKDQRQKMSYRPRRWSRTLEFHPEWNGWVVRLEHAQQSQDADAQQDPAKDHRERAAAGAAAATAAAALAQYRTLGNWSGWTSTSSQSRLDKGGKNLARGGAFYTPVHSLIRPTEYTLSRVHLSLNC